MDSEVALRIATPFGGGMVNSGETCGAMTGALMVIGLATGNVAASDKDSKEKAYQLAEKFMASFKSHNGSIVCRELLGCDVSIPEDLQAAGDQGLFRTRCSSYVKDAAQILENLLDIGQSVLQDDHESFVD